MAKKPLNLLLCEELTSPNKHHKLKELANDAISPRKAFQITHFVSFKVYSAPIEKIDGQLNPVVQIPTCASFTHLLGL